MAKLTKQEVNAIASKLHREITEKHRLEYNRAYHEYIPSPDYLEIESAYKRMNEIEELRDSLTKEKDQLSKNVQNILNKRQIERKYWYDDILQSIIKSDIKIHEVPSIEELKDDIIIAAIDTDFDVEKYLKLRLENIKII